MSKINIQNLYTRFKTRNGVRSVVNGEERVLIAPQEYSMDVQSDYEREREKIKQFLSHKKVSHIKRKGRKRR